MHAIWGSPLTLISILSVMLTMLLEIATTSSETFEGSVSSHIKAATALANALESSRLDYCNSLLYAMPEGYKQKL